MKTRELISKLENAASKNPEADVYFVWFDWNPNHCIRREIGFVDIRSDDAGTCIVRLTEVRDIEAVRALLNDVLFA